MVLSTGLGSSLHMCHLGRGLGSVFAFDLCNFVARQESDYCNCSGFFLRPQGSDTKPASGCFFVLYRSAILDPFLDFQCHSSSLPAGFIAIEEQ